MKWMRVAGALVALALGAGAATAQAAELTIVHSVPGFTADVYVNGKKELAGFGAGTMAPRVPLKAGTYHIAIRKAGSSPTSKAVLASTLHLKATDDLAVVAHIGTSGMPMLTVYRNRFRSEAPGQTLLVVRHVADAPPVDVYVDNQRVMRRLTHMAAGSVALAAGQHQVRVVVAGTQRSIYEPVDIALQPGKVYVVYTVGVAKKHTLDELVDTVSVRALPPDAVPAGQSGLVDRVTGATSSPGGRALGLLGALLVAIVGILLARSRLRERWSSV
jgi:hypothetical protein